MDAKTNIKARLPSREITEGGARALHRPFERGMACGDRDAAEIFKKTPYGADSGRGGRHVAKELFEADGIPFLTTTLPDHGALHGGGVGVTRRTIAKTSSIVRTFKSVQSNPNKAEKVSHADA